MKKALKGFKRNFQGDNLIAYDRQMEGEVTLRRIDKDISVSLSYNPSVITGDKRINLLMGKTLQGKASDQERKLFKELWQKRVKEILLTKTLRHKIIQVV